MAKSSNGGKTKATNGETKARRTPARRRTDKSAADATVAMAADLARLEQAADTAALARPLEAVGPSPEEVRRRAYDIYVRRGRADGSDVEDWLEAERQLGHSRH
jgi:hypothetical protein